MSAIRTHLLTNYASACFSYIRNAVISPYPNAETQRDYIEHHQRGHNRALMHLRGFRETAMSWELMDPIDCTKSDWLNRAVNV